MKAVILSIGDELLIGQVVNTNASYLGEKLLTLGIPAEKIITLSDNKNEILKEFREAFSRYDIILVTGGLGPTHDDITKHCITEFFNTELVHDQRVQSHIDSIFKRRNMKTPEASNFMAMVPKGCKVLFNRVGTAPGMLFEKKRKVFISVPGVPHELYYIWEKHIEQYLRKKIRTRKIKNEIIVKTIHTIGLSESILAEKIGSIESLNKEIKDAEVSLAFLPSNYEVRLRLTVRARTKKQTQNAMRSVIQKLRHRAGKYIYSYNAELLAKVVGNKIRKLDYKLAVAESCTGGLITSKITDIAGSADYFLEGFVTYSNESKVRILGVKESSLKAGGAVSKKVAEEMAEGARKKAKADIGISTTGLAGPGGATPQKPVGLVWIGYSDKGKTFAEKFIFTRDRLRNKDIMSKMALEILRRELIKKK